MPGKYGLTILILIFILWVSVIQDTNVAAEPQQHSFITVNETITRTIRPTIITVIPTHMPHINVKINSVPQEAQLYIDSTNRGITPVTVTIEPGSHSILLQKKGYQDYSTEATFTGPTSQTYVLVEETPTYSPTHAPHCTAQITSVPSGAQLYVDGVGYGYTPASVTFTQFPEYHSILIVETGYQDFTTTIGSDICGQSFVWNLVPITQTITPEITQTARYTIQINSVPSGAQITVDGVDYGYTPVSVTIASVPVSHSILLEKPGYQDFTTTIRSDILTQQSLVYYLVPVTQTTTSVIPQTAHCNVQIDSDPSGALLRLDSRDCGTTPLTVSLEPGSHYLLLSKEGFRDYSESIDLNRDAYLRFSLVPIDESSPTFTTPVPGTPIFQHETTTIPGFGAGTLVTALSVIVVAVGTGIIRRRR